MRKVLQSGSTTHICHSIEGDYLAAALCSEVWQNKNRTSFTPLVKAYLAAMAACSIWEVGERGQECSPFEEGFEAARNSAG